MGRRRTRHTPGVRRVQSYHSWRTPPARLPTVSRVASAPIAAEFHLTVQCPTSLFSLGLSHGDFRSEGSRVCVARHGFGECPIALLTPRIREGLTCRTSRPLHRAPDASHVRPSRVSGGARHSSFRSLRLPGAPPRLATALVSRAPLPCLFLRLWRFRRTTGSCRVSPANAARTATRRRRRCGATDRTGQRRSATRAECAITGGTPRCAPPSRNPGKSLMTLEAPA